MYSKTARVVEDVLKIRLQTVLHTVDKNMLLRICIHTQIYGKYFVFLNMQLVYNSNLFGSHSKTSFEKNCFSAWASTLNMGLINKVDMVCLSPVGYVV